jgi:tetratricopeptide (TPR) repeat protein
MRAYVFTDASLARYAGQFVWLSVDIEDKKNAQFMTKYSTPGVPTFFVIDPKSEAVTTRYVGGFSVDSLKKFLNDNRGKSGREDDALVRADRLASADKHAEAAAAYEEALKALPKKSLRYGRAAEGLIFSFAMTREGQGRCADRGLELARELKGTVSGANIASQALDCEGTLAPDKRNAETFATLEKMVGDNIHSKTLDLSGDDRSGYYIVLIGAHDAMKDEEGARKLRQEWSAFLDAEAAKAKTAEARAVYDPHRLTAYMELGEPGKAIPMLQQSARDFPKDYNPLSRLATAYRAMKMWDEAIVYGKKALALCEGPRRIVIYRGLTDAYLGKGDKAGAAATLKEAIAYAEALPTGQRSENMIAALKKKLEAM